MIKSLQSCFIAGKWTAGKGDKLTVINPATNKVVWQANAANSDDVANAFVAADNAFKHWALTPLSDRIDIIKKYKSLLATNKDTIANDILIDTGKPAWEVKTEVEAMIGKVDLSIKAYHERTPTKSTGESLLTHRPHGVCAVFGPYNFPGHLPNGHIVPALIAGNCIIFKPSEQTPSVGATIVKLLHESGVPDGVINFVVGEIDVAKAIADNNKLRGFFFTGSSTVGSIISQQFAQRLEVILALEMGGNNPLIVQKDVLKTDADINAAVYNTIQSAFISAGQRCTCARRLIVPKGQEGDNFLKALVVKTQKLLIDLPTSDKQPFYSMMISNKAVNMLLDAQRKLLSLGGISLLTMKRLSEDKPMVTPAIIDVTKANNVPDEEYFGPLLKVYRTDSFVAAIELANNTKYGLSAGIFTNNNKDWDKFYALSQAGIINRNKPLTGASGSAPFGGTGISGNHRPGGYYAADYCSYPVVSMTSDTLK